MDGPQDDASEENTGSSERRSSIASRSTTGRLKPKLSRFARLMGRNAVAVVVAVVAGVATFLLTSIFSSQTPVRQSSHLPEVNASTEKLLYSPDELSVDVNHTPSTHANCWTLSIASPRPDAYRCMIGNYIYDPCFTSELLKPTVVCPTAPWRNVAFTAIPTSPLSDIDKGLTQQEVALDRGAHPRPIPSNVTSNPNYVWALKLSNGVGCFKATGASGGIASLNATFDCTNGGQLEGAIDTANVLWTAVYFPPATHVAIQMPIAEAWF